jgi:hypothetical protein
MFTWPAFSLTELMQPTNPVCSGKSCGRSAIPGDSWPPVGQTTNETITITAIHVVVIYLSHGVGV